MPHLNMLLLSNITFVGLKKTCVNTFHARSTLKSGETLTVFDAFLNKFQSRQDQVLGQGMEFCYRRRVNLTDYRKETCIVRKHAQGKIWSIVANEINQRAQLMNIHKESIFYLHMLVSFFSAFHLSQTCNLCEYRRFTF